jgi:hypothetical protein
LTNEKASWNLSKRLYSCFYVGRSAAELVVTDVEPLLTLSHRVSKALAGNLDRVPFAVKGINSVWLVIRFNQMTTSNDEYIASLSPVVQERIAEARQRDEDDGDNIVLLHGFESAMIGTARNQYDKTVAVYEEGLCIRLLMDEIHREHPDVSEDDLYSEAMDCWCYNTLRTIPYLAERAPVIIQGFDSDVL